MPRAVGSDQLKPTDKEQLATIQYSFSGGNITAVSRSSGPTGTLFDLTLKEVTLAESLLTPGLQTSLKFQSTIHTPNKNYDDFKNSVLNMIIDRPVLERDPWNFIRFLVLQQRVYRISNRRLYNNNIEELTIHACDDSLLNDARSLVSKSWACGSTPSTIAQDVLTNCLNIPGDRMQIESSGPPRTYIAENIHPFQVINENANVALNGEDPSFVHFMTYENLGTHYFCSLKSLIRQQPVGTFTYAEIGAASGYPIPTNIMTYSFPCDFDLLSDILNGVDVDGTFLNTIATFNPITKMMSLFGNKAVECGIGGGNIIYPATNLGSAENQFTCNNGIEKYLLRRQARMNLLEQDKISLRMTVPWNPSLTAGKTINVELKNRPKTSQSYTELNYGSGKYLISSLIHNIKSGGFSTTTLDCISETAASNGVI
jgi:hypothetical protein